MYQKEPSINMIQEGMRLNTFQRRVVEISKKNFKHGVLKSFFRGKLKWRHDKFEKGGNKDNGYDSKHVLL